MRSLLPAGIMLVGFGAWAVAMPDAGTGRGGGVTNLTPDFSHFQIILDRMPFGQPPPAAPAPAPEAAKQALAEQALAKQIRLCAVTRTEQGVAAGLIDSSANPPKNYYLYVGEVMDGVTLVSANLEDESAEIEKDGARLTFTLTGVKAAAPPAGGAFASRGPFFRTPTAAVPQPAPAAPAAPASEVQQPGFIRRPSQAGMPPMPGIPAVQRAEMQKTRDEIAKLRETGGDVSSYMERLRERKRLEKEEKASAEQAAREKLQELARKVTENELAKREREINLTLIEQGARPVSNIELTAEEEKALVEKGILP